MRTRILNNRESEVVDALRTRGKFNKAGTLRVGYKHDGNFTIALVKRIWAKGEFPYTSDLVGCSKRNPTDSENPRIGELLAFRRALLGK